MPPLDTARSLPFVVRILLISLVGAAIGFFMGLVIGKGAAAAGAGAAVGFIAIFVILMIGAKRGSVVDETKGSNQP